MRHRFLSSQQRNFSWIRQKKRFSPQTPVVKIAHFGNVMSIDTTLPKMGDFYNGDLFENSLSFVGSCWNFVSGYIKIVDIHHVSFSSIKQVVKKLLPKSLWQTYMKWAVTIWLLAVECCWPFQTSWIKLRSQNMGPNLRPKLFDILAQSSKLAELKVNWKMKKRNLTENIW